MLAFEMVDIETHTIGLGAANARLESTEMALHDMSEPLHQIVDDMYAHTRNWMDSWGDGTYDPLEPSTVADKLRLGYTDPTRPLYGTGKLLESASTPAGPYSLHDTAQMEAWIGVDWNRDGWNIPALHQTGVPWELVHRRAYVTRTGKSVRATSYMWHLPQRPIFTIDEALMRAGGEEILAHIHNPLA